jgi:hypothetical protein
MSDVLRQLEVCHTARLPRLGAGCWQGRRQGGCMICLICCISHPRLHPQGAGVRGRHSRPDAGRQRCQQVLLSCGCRSSIPRLLASAVPGQPAVVGQRAAQPTARLARLRQQHPVKCALAVSSRFAPMPIVAHSSCLLVAAWSGARTSFCPFVQHTTASPDSTARMFCTGHMAKTQIPG